MGYHLQIQPHAPRHNKHLPLPALVQYQTEHPTIVYLRPTGHRAHLCAQKGTGTSGRSSPLHVCQIINPHHGPQSPNRLISTPPSGGLPPVPKTNGPISNNYSSIQNQNRTQKACTNRNTDPYTPPSNLTQARQYPDAKQWDISHNAELDNLDAHHSIEWLPSHFQPPHQSIITLMMIYRYKRSAEGHIIQRKARCNLRGDLMKPGLRYSPNHTATYTADRTTQRLLIAIHATTKYPLEHFDIKFAYLHEQYQQTNPIYVK